MANNRMFIVCDECEARLFLMKYYPSTKWFLPDLDKQIKKDMEDFINEHEHDSNVNQGSTHFTLKFESSDKPIKKL